MNQGDLLSIGLGFLTSMAICIPLYVIYRRKKGAIYEFMLRIGQSRTARAMLLGVCVVTIIGTVISITNRLPEDTTLVLLA